MDNHTSATPQPPSPLRIVVPVLIGGAACLVTVTNLSAQAWVPHKEGGVFEVTYARATATRHITSKPTTNPETGVTGESLYYGYEYSNIGVFSLDYGITDRLAVRAGLSYVSSKFNGLPAWQEGEWDDGTYHGSPTDLAAEVRYVAVQTKNLVFTPFLGFVLPTNDYISEGHAAPGRGLTQVPVGAGFGYTWTFPVHTTYFQARYAYAYLNANDYDFARSNAFVEAGTFLARWCSIRAIIGGEKTHGGVQWEAIDTPEELEFHDQRTSSRYLSAAGGVTFIVSPTVSLSASYSQLIEGANIVNTQTLWASVNWYFGGPGSKLIGKSR